MSNMISVPKCSLVYVEMLHEIYVKGHSDHLFTKAK